jgi:hypothetical protein
VTGAVQPAIVNQAPGTLITGGLWNTQFGAAAAWYLNAPMIVWRQAAAQSIPNGAWTPLAFDTIDLDTHGVHLAAAPSRFTAPYAGWYALTGQSDWAANATGARELKFLINGGGTTLAKAMVMAVNGYDTALSVATECYLSAGDYVELAAWQNAGAALSTSGTDGLPRFTARWVHT